MKNNIRKILERIYNNELTAYLDLDACIIYDNPESAEEDGAWLVKEINSNDFDTVQQFISKVESYM